MKQAAFRDMVKARTQATRTQGTLHPPSPWHAVCLSLLLRRPRKGAQYWASLAVDFG